MSNLEPLRCEAECRTESSAEVLNRSCHCISVDQEGLRRKLQSDLGGRGLSGALLDTHPHLFAPLPVFIARAHLQEMARVVAAVERLVAMPTYRSIALKSAPPVAQFDTGIRGGLLGFDFHLSAAGPKLIEINTNPGGALLNAVLLGAQQACCSTATDLASLLQPAEAEHSLCEVLLAEWRLQRGTVLPRTVAIMDDAPQEQYLYPEFLLYQQALRRRGLDVFICDPREVARTNAQLRLRDTPLDFVYNRLTDFALERSDLAPLRSAYLAGEVVLSPNPHAHALYANKRNLCLLGDSAFLHSTGIDGDDIETLLRALPHTEMVTVANREALWSRRRQLFFKPVAGYAGKAAYRGDKLTKRVWEDIAGRDYVAQELIAPTERHSVKSGNAGPLKVDVRNYAYAGSVLLVAARLYQGQTTNFRTPGGGFAPVLTSRV